MDESGAARQYPSAVRAVVKVVPLVRFVEASFQAEQSMPSRHSVQRGDVCGLLLLLLLLLEGSSFRK